MQLIIILFVIYIFITRLIILTLRRNVGNNTCILLNFNPFIMKKNYYLAILLFCCTLLSSAQDNKTIIATYMGAHLNNLELSLTDATDFKILSEGTLSNKDFKTTYLQQEINGIPVSGTSATVLSKNGQILKFSHVFTSNIRNLVSVQTASLTVKDAANRAIELLGLASSTTLKVVDHKTQTDISKSDLATSAIEAPLYYYKAESGQFVLVYEIVIKESGAHWWVTKINAKTGTLESKEDAMISCTFGPSKVTANNPSNHAEHSHTFKSSSSIATKANVQTAMKATTSNSTFVANEASYVAYPLRIESPTHGDRTTIINPAMIPTIPAGTAVPSPNGWHALLDTVTSRTEGNNVAAYEDVLNLNAPATDSSFAYTTTPGSLEFDYSMDLTNPKGPSTYQKAAIVNLFVWNNYMHDISYAYGFDETNGNFQEDNYGRFVSDGVFLPSAGDGVKAQAQDGDGINNANFGTGIDGGNPTMQMYLWGASPFGLFFDVVSRSGDQTDPGNLVRTYDSARFPFFPIPREDTPDNLPQTATLVLVQDDMTPYAGLNNGNDPSGAAGTSASEDPTDGCTTYTTASAAAVMGNIAVIRRGNCPFVAKITLAQDNGAIGVVMINNVPGDGPVNGGGEPYKDITIPAISLSFEDGEALIEAMQAGETLTGVLKDDGPPTDLINRDGDIDQGIIAHEYGHGISTRLVGGRNNAYCLLSLTFEEEMGEGWSDFFGLVTTQRLSDTEQNNRGIGTYVQFQDVDGAGIRPAQYSTDMSVNDFTYAHLPAAERQLTVPHGIGFVWATMLWDMYWELINEYGFDQDMYFGTGGNNIAMQLVMDGLKLSTCGAVGFVDGRDAIIAADAALYDGANECLIRSVFARRGVGFLATQGTSESREDQVPDFSTGNAVLGICPTLAIADENKTIFTIYPNPSTDEIYIRNNRNTGSAVYKITDLNGRVIETNKITLVNGARIVTGHLSSGMYIVTLKTDSGETYSQKIIKN
jgi:hypothetical protein